jgi:hypothetical protein
MHKTEHTRKPEARLPRMRKISITVEAGVLEDVRRLARHSGLTLSAQVTDSLARDLRRRRLRELIEDYEREHGEITDPELAALSHEPPRVPPFSQGNRARSTPRCAAP